MINFENQFNEFNQHTGDLLETEQFLLFFGAIQGDTNYIEKIFSFKPHFVNQVHSDILVEADPEREFEADALWTNKTNFSIGVRTADCLPIAIISHDFCMMIHAGWRGLANNIIGKSLVGFQTEAATAYIGPHIHLSSFEIKEDAGVLLIQAYKEVEKFDIAKEPLTRRHIEPEKSLFNLSKLARAQLVSTGIAHTKIYSSPIDTFANKQFHSFRRDKEAAGRNISFCILKKT